MLRMGVREPFSQIGRNQQANLVQRASIVRLAALLCVIPCSTATALGQIGAAASFCCAINARISFMTAPTIFGMQ